MRATDLLIPGALLLTAAASQRSDVPTPSQLPGIASRPPDLDQRFAPHSEQLARNAYAEVARRDLRLLKGQSRLLEEVLDITARQSPLLQRARDPRTVAPPTTTTATC